MSEKKTAESGLKNLRAVVSEVQRKECVLFAWDASCELVRFALRVKTDGFKLESSVLADKTGNITRMSKLRAECVSDSWISSLEW